MRASPYSNILSLPLTSFVPSLSTPPPSPLQMGGYKDERVIDIGPLRLNPGVSIISFVILWALAIWCMVDSSAAKNELVLARDWVAYWFTWLYIGSQDVWVVFALYIYAYYGDKKMCAPGKEKEKPEFGDASYFMMLFTCGVAVGMFYYGTTEPTSYYTGYSGNRCVCLKPPMPCSSAVSAVSVRCLLLSRLNAECVCFLLTTVTMTTTGTPKILGSPTPKRPSGPSPSRCFTGVSTAGSRTASSPSPWDLPRT